MVSSGALAGFHFVAPVANSTDKVLIVIALASRRRKLSRPLYALAAATLFSGLLGGALPALAQQGTVPPADRPAPPAQPKAQPAASGDAVASRIGRLEEQFVDLQVMVGTLESLLKSKPSAVLPQESALGQPGGPQSAGQGDLGSRVDALETQIMALTSQLEQMTQQMGAIEARLSGAPQPSPQPPRGEPPRGEPPGRQGLAPDQPSDTALAAAGGEAAEPTSFGTTSVTPAFTAEPPLPEANEPRLPRGDAPGGLTASEEQPQSLAATTPGADARSLYDEGYGELFKRDYPAAEAAFRQFLRSYPDDALAGNAQYWLGETYYVRGQYKKAADAFLKGYKTYRSSQMAPDSLLKLGMALAQLGQKDSACSTFSELGTKFPSASDHVRDQAKSESQKAGC
jgi:tol-pal system protein YbgF